MQLSALTYSTTTTSRTLARAINRPNTRAVKRGQQQLRTGSWSEQAIHKSDEEVQLSALTYSSTTTSRTLARAINRSNTRAVKRGQQQLCMGSWSEQAIHKSDKEVQLSAYIDLLHHHHTSRTLARAINRPNTRAVKRGQQQLRTGSWSEQAIARQQWVVKVSKDEKGTQGKFGRGGKT